MTNNLHARNKWSKIGERQLDMPNKNRYTVIDIDIYMYDAYMFFFSHSFIHVEVNI